MKYEIKQCGEKWKLVKDGNPQRNQQSRLFNLFMKGNVLTRQESVQLTGCYKLPSRCGEINQALSQLMGGLFEVSHEKLPTKHGGYVYRYFLTDEQRKAINNKVKQ